MGAWGGAAGLVAQRVRATPRVFRHLLLGTRTALHGDNFGTGVEAKLIIVDEAGVTTTLYYPADVIGEDADDARGIQSWDHQLIKALGPVFVMQRLVGRTHALQSLRGDYSALSAGGRAAGCSSRASIRCFNSSTAASSSARLWPLSSSV